MLMLTLAIESSPFVESVSGFLGALLGGVVSVGVMVYNQKRGAEALRRRLVEGHFDLFQDVADCAGEYERGGTFGIFRDRLSSQVRDLRDDLYRDVTGNLEFEAYRRLYRSFSSVDYMIFAHDRSFARDLMVNYINGCLTDMREAQKYFGDMPKPRPNAENEILNGRSIG